MSKDPAAKVCPVCSTGKPLKDFSSPGGKWKRKHCKECECRRKAKWRRDNLDTARTMDREKNLRIKYGLTLEDYNAMVFSQMGLCLCCTKPTKRLVVDHCHKTGRIRGLLCVNCNSAVGQLHESEAHVLAVLDYVRHLNSTK